MKTANKEKINITTFSNKKYPEKLKELLDFLLLNNDIKTKMEKINLSKLNLFKGCKL